MLRAPDARHLCDQPSAVLTGVEVAPFTLAAVVARAGHSALRAGQIGTGMLNVDGHAAARQVNIHLGHLPGRLNTENLAVKLAIVHETGLSSGRARSLSESLNPNKTGKSQKEFKKGSPADFFIRASSWLDGVTPRTPPSVRQNARTH